MRLDLHIHTTASDGAWSPERIVERADGAGLHVIAVTDHDTASAVPAAQLAARETGVTVISGIELSSTHEGHDIHILGYGIDPRGEAIREHQRRARSRRIERMEAMVDRLRSQGVEVTPEDVRTAAGTEGEMLGRPHLAQALVESGAVATVEEAFDDLIADHHPAFVPTELGSPVEAVATVQAAGGLAVWAHPPLRHLHGLLPGLVEAGLCGLEAYRPRWTRSRVRQVVKTARSAGLVVTGGSDWHGPDRNGSLGDFWVPGQRMEGFLERFGSLDSTP